MRIWPLKRNASWRNGWCGSWGTFAKKTGLRNLCIAGGVGLNVKMNSRIYRSGIFDDVFIFPIPSDSGTSSVRRWECIRKRAVNVPGLSAMCSGVPRTPTRRLNFRYNLAGLHTGHVMTLQKRCRNSLQKARS